jgi:hypothetical protein
VHPLSSRSSRMFSHLLLSLAVAASFACSPESAVREEGVAEPVSVVCEGAVPWNEASKHLGQTATVDGPVVSAVFASDSNGQPTFLNIGKPYPDPNRFTVVIWGEDRDVFPEPPEVAYASARVCVRGPVSTYQGVTQIIIDGPEDIVLAG